MFLDCHTHIFEMSHIGKNYVEDTKRVLGEKSSEFRATPADHLVAMRSVDKAIVLGLQAKDIGYDVPNDYIASYVGKHQDKMIGFASVNPNAKGADKELRRSVEKLGLKGLKLGPIYQHFDPRGRAAMRIFSLAEQLEIPVLIHQAATYVRNAPLKYANPILLEEVALKFPDLRLILAHLGFPWEDETAVMVRKQPNVFTDISAIHTRLYRLYNKLMTFKEYGVLDKIVFGSDFPSYTPEESVKGINQVNGFAREHSLPEIPEEAIDAIIHKNASRVFSTIL